MATTQRGGLFRVGGKLVNAEGQPAKRMKLVENEAEPSTANTDGDLAEDFPARDVLVEGGFDSLEKVRAASDEQLVELKGIGEKTVEEIRKAQG